VKEKERKRGRRRGLARGGFDGPLGRRAKKDGRVSFVFFVFLFFNLFSNQSLNSNSNQNYFKLFTKFCNLFRSHTSNQKTMQSQIMMHNHLLSLY
jgi:hypothetical protein